MKTVTASLVIMMLVLSGAAAAGERGHGHKKHDFGARHDLYEYARVISVEPVYIDVEVSKPVRECWQEPVYHTGRQQSKSAGGMLAGGLIGGVIGHQVGKGRGNKLATAVGTLIGAQIGHQAVNGHADHDDHAVHRTVGYEEHCKTRHQVAYEQVLDGYDVTYKYRGRHYQIEMPYHPGKRIKMRIQFSPVI